MRAGASGSSATAAPGAASGARERPWKLWGAGTPSRVEQRGRHIEGAGPLLHRSARRQPGPAGAARRECAARHCPTGARRGPAPAPRPRGARHGRTAGPPAWSPPAPGAPTPRAASPTSRVEGAHRRVVVAHEGGDVLGRGRRGARRHLHLRRGAETPGTPVALSDEAALVRVWRGVGKVGGGGEHQEREGGVRAEALERSQGGAVQGRGIGQLGKLAALGEQARRKRRPRQQGHMRHQHPLADEVREVEGRSHHFLEAEAEAGEEIARVVGHHGGLPTRVPQRTRERDEVSLQHLAAHQRVAQRMLSRPLRGEQRGPRGGGARHLDERLAELGALAHQPIDVRRRRPAVPIAGEVIGPQPIRGKDEEIEPPHLRPLPSGEGRGEGSVPN